MSPFAKLLRDHRIKAGLPQKELAELLGFEQSYLSALELGLKGPPNMEFASQLVMVLELDQEEQIALMEALAASQRRVDVPNEAPIEIFWMCHKLRQQIDRLHPLQIELMMTALNLPSEFNLGNTEQPTRLRRRSHKSTIQGAKM